jgi:alkanesulfonate monooxygenase SsuD/methylene tetrahydromethanopterin reductase-like flavin-dependent oxidoreductase (luciferase family)
MSDRSERELLLQIAGEVGEIKGTLNALVGSPDSTIGQIQTDIADLQKNDTVLKWFTAALTAFIAWLGWHTNVKP